MFSTKDFQGKDNIFNRVVEKDREVRFGDGGYCELKYPIYFCPLVDPKGKQETKSKALLQDLTAEMARVASTRNDMQQNGVVEDIVDPELYPQFIPSGERKKPLFPQDPDDIKDVGKGSTERNLLWMDDCFVRALYSWIPTLVAWDVRNKECRIVGSIQNLPRTKTNEKLYSLLQESLSAFMPTFVDECGAIPYEDQEITSRFCRMWPIVSDNGDDDYKEIKYFNICIKLQRYHIPPGSEYKGQWHTEGVNEEVSAVGVLYTDWPEGLTGGAVKFRIPKIPDGYYRTQIGNCPPLSVTVQGQQGSALAFRNSLPHRFTKLVNNVPQGKRLTRSFVNFFAVSPTLRTTLEIPTNADIYLALIGGLNHDVVGVILEFLQLTPITHKAALELRAQAKAEMVATKGKWGEINYGNCGYLTFFPNGNPTAEEEETVREWAASLDELQIENEWGGTVDEYDATFFEKIKEYKSPEEVKKVHHLRFGPQAWDEYNVKSHLASSSSEGRSLPEQ